MSSRKRIAGAALVMSIATSISRVSGLIRDMVVARFFGAGVVTDAFFMAFTIPNLLRRFFAEGSLTAAFVPVFSEVFHRRGEEEAQQLANRCATLLLLVMFVVVGLGLICSPWIVQAIGYGFAQTEGKLELTHQLNLIMFPYIAMVSLLALLTGILNVRGHFFLPSLSPVLLNLAMIFGALSLGQLFQRPIFGLALGVLLGGVLQLLLQYPVLLRFRIRLRPDFRFFQDEQLRKITLLMLPGIAGVAIYQINIVISRLLASFLPDGSVSYLYYGQRLFEFPQGIFVVSLAQAVLPMMSRQIADGDEEGMQQSLNFSLTLIALLTLPAMVGLVLCAKPVFSLFFLGGEFSLTDMNNSALALVCFAPGLLFVGFSRIAAQTFYALQDTRTPVVVSFWTLLVNLGAGLLLMQWLGFIGLALALTIASLFNAAVLLALLQRKLKLRLTAQLLAQSVRIVIACLPMALLVYLLLGMVDWNQFGSSAYKGLILAFSVGSGVVVFAGSCLLLKIDEIHQLLHLIRNKLRRDKQPVEHS
ncbi:MAG: murein biosynthesis integral membrane protein MurJ [Pelovirga sp.]